MYMYAIVWVYLCVCVCVQAFMHRKQWVTFPCAVLSFCSLQGSISYLYILRLRCLRFLFIFLLVFCIDNIIKNKK